MKIYKKYISLKFERATAEWLKNCTSFSEYANICANPHFIHTLPINLNQSKSSIIYPCSLPRQTFLPFSVSSFLSLVRIFFSHHCAMEENLTTVFPELLIANQTSSNDEKELSFIDYFTFASFVLRLIIAFIGVLSNLLVIFCILYFKFLRKVNNFFVANLATIDCLTLLLDLCLFLPCNVPPPLDQFDMDYINCNLASVGNTLTFMGLIALILISVDRFIFIIKPLHYEKFRRHWFKLTFSLCWLVCPVIWSLSGVFLMCPRGNRNEPIYNSMIFTSFVIWFIVVAVLYSVIFTVAYKQNMANRKHLELQQKVSQIHAKQSYLNKMELEPEPEQQPTVDSGVGVGDKFQQNQFRIITGYALIVGISLLTFFFMEALELVFILSPNTNDHSGFLNALVEVARVQLTINSAVNPFIYGATQRVYREAFVSVLSLNFVREGLFKSMRSNSNGCALNTVKVDLDV